MKEKKVLNGEQIRRKEEKNFSLGLMIGLGLFIIFMVATNNNFGEWIPFSLNYEVINTPSVFKYQENQGKEYQEFYNEYNKFIDEIESFNLDELKGDNFKKNDDYFIYSDNNYNYVAGSNYIKLVKEGKDKYYNVIEDDIQVITLYSEKEYELEISNSLITFSFDNLEYKFEILQEGYKMIVDYNVDNFSIFEEYYDKDFKFLSVKGKYNNINYDGYLVKDLKGYSLSEDKSVFCKDNSEECELSTKYIENSEVIYYTLVDYFFNSVYSNDMLFVKENEVFPFV